MIRVLIAIDDERIRNRLGSLIEADSGLELVGSYAFNEAKAGANETDLADIVLLSPPLLTLEHLIEYRRPFRHSLAILVADEDTELVRESALAADFAACCVLALVTMDLVKLIYRCSNGEWPLADLFSLPGISQSLLSVAEIRILRRMCDGMTNTEIADSLGLSSQTIKDHVSSILRKMAVNDRTQAVILAMRRRGTSDKGKPDEVASSPAAQPETKSPEALNPVGSAKPARVPVPSRTGAEPTPHNFRIMIVEQSALIRQSLAAMLETEADFTIVGPVATTVGALALANDDIPDIALVGTAYPDITWMKSTRMLRRQYPQMVVIVLASSTSDDVCLDAIRVGAAAVIDHDVQQARLVQTIGRVARGENELFELLQERPSLAERVMERFRSYSRPLPIHVPGESALLDLEEQILKLVTQRMSAAAIAKKLGVAPNVVRNFIQSILEANSEENPPKDEEEPPTAGVLRWPRGPIPPPDTLRAAAELPTDGPSRDMG